MKVRLFSVPAELATTAKTVVENLLADQPSVKGIDHTLRGTQADIHFKTGRNITADVQAEALRTVILERALTAGVIYIARRGGQ